MKPTRVTIAVLVVLSWCGVATADDEQYGQCHASGTRAVAYTLEISVLKPWHPVKPPSGFLNYVDRRIATNCRSSRESELADEAVDLDCLRTGSDEANYIQMAPRECFTGRFAGREGIDRCVAANVAGLLRMLDSFGGHDRFINKRLHDLCRRDRDYYAKN